MNVSAAAVHYGREHAPGDLCSPSGTVLLVTSLLLLLSSTWCLSAKGMFAMMWAVVVSTIISTTAHAQTCLSGTPMLVMDTADVCMSTWIHLMAMTYIISAMHERFMATTNIMLLVPAWAAVTTESIGALLGVLIGTAVCAMSVFIWYIGHRVPIPMSRRKSGNSQFENLRCEQRVDAFWDYHRPVKPISQSNSHSHTARSGSPPAATTPKARAGSGGSSSSIASARRGAVAVDMPRVSGGRRRPFRRHASQPLQPAPQMRTLEYDHSPGDTGVERRITHDIALYPWWKPPQLCITAVFMVATWIAQHVATSLHEYRFLIEGDTLVTVSLDVQAATMWHAIWHSLTACMIMMLTQSRNLPVSTAVRAEAAAAGPGCSPVRVLQTFLRCGSSEHAAKS